MQTPQQLPHDDIVVSKYIGRPLLVDGYKFDLRLYVAVTSFEPLRAYIYDEGLARFSTVKYTNDHADQPSHLSNPFMHLTNYSINKKSSDFVPNQDASQDGEGTKWSLSALRRRLAQSGIDVPALFAKIDALVLKTLIAVEPSVVAATRRYCHHRNSCFEMVGFDVLIDENLKPWLIEVNLSPSLAADSPIDLKLKTQMLASLFTLVGLRPYDRSQHRRAQQKKQAERWNRMARGEPGARIRSTPADLLRSPEAMRAVVELDDEEAKCGNWKRIFPVAHGHTYRRLFAQERPMNSLLVDVLIARRKAARRADPTPADPVGAAPADAADAADDTAADDATAARPRTAKPHIPTHRPSTSSATSRPSSSYASYSSSSYAKREAAYKRPGRPTSAGMRRALRDAVMAGRADEGLSNAGPAARIESALRLLGAATPADEATTAAENVAASPQGGAPRAPPPRAPRAAAATAGARRAAPRDLGHRRDARRLVVFTLLGRTRARTRLRGRFARRVPVVGSARRRRRPPAVARRCRRGRPRALRSRFAVRPSTRSATAARRPLTARQEELPASPPHARPS